MDLSNLKDTYNFILLEFFAEWCSSCQTMFPIIDKFESNMQDKLEVIKIDIDKNPQIAGIYQIKNVPTFVLFKNGKEIWRQVGLITNRELKLVFQKFNVETENSNHI
ncbi:MAG TPA: thioredoxin family protein [Niabella sp.]|jgi:thioredoxin 1|nr:thioredoxin family protein [Chitinophagaceae bacterium]HRN47486.1 thioredoxin family protein [Niabella sp.]HRO84723.1 thioredoxin family protein [Niabella sp.]HUN03989.1 thioredoxin family protein [Niabella sp.]